MDEENVGYTTARSEASEDEQTRKVRGYLGSDITLPAGVLSDIPLRPPKGFKERLLWQMDVSYQTWQQGSPRGISEWFWH